MALTIITAYIAMYGIYKWGEVDEYIEFAEKQNQAYQTNTGQLQTTRDRLQKEVKQMEKNVENLDAESIELKQCLKSFDELKEALEDIVDEDEEILDLIDALNQQYRDIKMMAINKDKAQLLLTYYKIKLGGANRRLFAKEDYERFIGRLNDSTRELYNKEGGFDAMDLNNDGNVDPDEFIQMTEKVLAITEDAFVALSLSPSNVNMLRQ